MEQQRRHLLWLGSPFAIGLTAFLCICFGVILTAFVVTSPDGQLLAVGMVGGVEMDLSFWRCLLKVTFTSSACLKGATSGELPQSQNA
jgi:hypothetical protein